MNNKNLPIIVAIAMPLIFLVVISLIVFLPTTSIKPEYNFIYSNGYEYGIYGYKNNYEVKDGSIVLSPTPLNTYEKIDDRKNAPKLFIYDVKDSSSREISFEDAKKMKLDHGPSSPDGYSIVYESGHYGIFEIFGSNDSNRGYFISKGKARKKLEGLSGNNGYYYNGDFDFIGWVK